MIKLKKLLMIHWQAYDFQVLEFDNITLLTGQTGVGKSTIVDALNVVVLGEKNRTIFNKAANENSSRTLDSYLYGKLGDDGENGYYYIREGNFTSYLVAEFENEDTLEHFCCGLVADCGEDRKYQSQWFIQSTGIPLDFFCDSTTKTPYSINNLQSMNNWGREENRISFYAFDKDYRKAIQGIFGQIRDDYRRLLKQSVSFTPIKNIERFLTDFVSDTEKRLDVVHMQSTIRRYNELEQENLRIKNKIERLEILRSELSRLESEKNNEQRQEFYIERAKLDLIQEKKQKLQSKKEELLIQITELAKGLAEIEQSLKLLQVNKDGLEHERAGLKILSDKQRLESELNHINEKYQDLKEKVEKSHSAMAKINSFMDEIKKNSLGYQEIVKDYSSYKQTTDLYAKIKEINESMGQVLKDIQTKQYENKKEIGTLQTDLSNLSAEKENIEKGIKSVPRHLRNFQEKLEQYLKQKSATAKTEFLADVIEFKPGEEKWHRAIEAYLNHQRYYLVLAPQYYNEALNFYKKCQKNGEVHGIGIINLQKVADSKPFVEENSLAKKIETGNSLVKHYVNYLLGRVAACEDILQLSNYNTVLTPEGFLYKGYVTRKLQFSGLTMSIGNGALEQQLSAVKIKIDEQKSVLLKLQAQAKQYELFNKYQKLDEHTCKDIMEYGNGTKLAEVKANKKKLVDKLMNLDQSELENLDRKIQQIFIQSDKLREETGSLKNQKESLSEQLEKLTEVTLPECIRDFEEQQQVWGNKFLGNPSTQSFYEAYMEAVSKAEDREWNNFIINYETRKKQTISNIRNLHNEITEKMGRYNSEFTENLPVSIEQSNIYLQELEKYSESELSKYGQAIHDSKKKAMEEFQFDFLGKLKENIENLKRQVEEINAALKGRMFGEDTYRFEVKANTTYKAYYDMIMDEMLMNHGEWNLLSLAFESKYQKQIEEMFSVLAGKNSVGMETDNQESRIRLYSDYKTYLDFDLIVKKGIQTQRLSKTYTDKSGGETQIPLYISLLAAFSQVYRVNTKRNNTLRLIILDEAFSKIDGEKIKQCIRLIKEFGLQALFSTPPEKMSEIMEEADKALVVFRNGNEAMVRAFKRQEEMPNELSSVFIE